MRSLQGYGCDVLRHRRTKRLWTATDRDRLRRAVNDAHLRIKLQSINDE